MSQDIDEVGFPFSEVKISDETWSIIERASRDREKLRKLLWELSEEDLCRFYMDCEEAMSWIQWAPFDYVTSQLEDGPFSEDGMEDLAESVVCHGREVYKNVFENPEEILPYARADEHHLLLCIASDVLYRKHGKEFMESPYYAHPHYKPRKP